MANRRERDIGDWIPLVIIVVLVVALGAYVTHRFMRPGASSATPSTAAAAASVAAPGTVPHHPIAEAATPASASTAPLPALDDSDASVDASLRALGGDRLRELLLPQQIVNRIVATVDALPRHELGSASILPLRTPAGAFLVSETQGSLVADTRNAGRYGPYMAVVRRADSSALVAWYVRNYPLFQQAYRKLGYPKGYFNDRLIAAIDDMLAAPQPAQPPALLLASGRYTYADPALESLSVGQKLMLRLGPANEAELKTKLRVIRELLTAKPVLDGAAP